MKKLPLKYRLIRGAIGKRFVIKHYKHGIIKTKFPNMKNIIPSEAQKQRRRLFRLAVKYAQSIYANPALKEEKRRIMRRPKRLFQSLMKEWFKKRAEGNFWNQRRLQQWKNNLVVDQPTIESLSQLNTPTHLISPAIKALDLLE